MDYRYLDYHCVYEATVTSGNRTEKSEAMRGAACFSSLFCRMRDIERKNGITLDLKLHCLKNPKTGKSNFLVLDDKEIKWWMRRIQGIVPFVYSITRTEEKNIINIHATGNFTELKFLCTFLRVFFEYPENEIAKDVYDLKNVICKQDNIDFKRVSALNLFLFGCELISAREIHTLQNTRCKVKATRIKNLKKELERNRDTLHDCFTYHEAKRCKMDFPKNSENCRKTFNDRVKDYINICKREKSILYSGS